VLWRFLQPSISNNSNAREVEDDRKSVIPVIGISYQIVSSDARLLETLCNMYNLPYSGDPDIFLYQSIDQILSGDIKLSNRPRYIFVSINRSDTLG